MRSTSARIGKYKMATSGGHVVIMKYAECTNSLSIFLFHSSLSSRLVSHNALPPFQLAERWKKIIDRSDLSSAGESRVKSKCLFRSFLFDQTLSLSDVVPVFYNVVKVSDGLLAIIIC